MYAPRFLISNKVLNNIGLIEAAKEVIENAPLVPSFEKRFQSDAIVRTVYHGTHIEGNDLSLAQTKKVIEGEEITAKARDIQEVINYRNVIKLLEELAQKRGGYEESMLTDIHHVTVDRVVAEDKAGNLRKSQVIIREEGTGKVVLKPPPFVEVPYLVKDFFGWLNSDQSGDIHPILKAGIVHYVLVAIHPFVEGNGRAARAFANLILMREKYDLKRFFALEEHFDKDLAGYYEAFAKVDKLSPSIDQRDLTAWLEYFTEVVAIELTKIKDKVRKLSIDTKLKIRIGEQVALTERQMRLVEYLSDQGSAVMQELRKMIPMVSDDTILRDVTDLIKKGIVKKEGSTKAARYVIVGGNKK